MPRGTSTSNFGSSGRESHDASAFYGRFRPPLISTDDVVARPEPVEDPFRCGDARSMAAVADNSVALVVTSPPYFAGKAYEEELGRNGIPASYLEYLQMLTEVFAECVRVLEPGGRIAVNVANLGRRPYRSLSSDVVGILERDLGLLLRGELIWHKADGAGGSCAWGSYRRAGNPVLRDLTERVIIASKGRFDRARSVDRRRAEGLPHESTLSTDDFLNLTLDVWSIAPESARRVGHPAPFPVELPDQLIRLYTYRNDLVLDPFMGSGSTLVAAALLDRRYVGYDLDARYVDIARHRVAEALDGRATATVDDAPSATRLADDELQRAGFGIERRDRRIRGTGVSVDIVGVDHSAAPWWFYVAGAHTSHRAGLRRSEVVWRTLAVAAALRRRRGSIPFVVLTTAVPPSGTDAAQALRAAGPETVFDVIDLCHPADLERLVAYASGGHRRRPLPGFWTAAEIAEISDDGTGPSADSR